MSEVTTVAHSPVARRRSPRFWRWTRTLLRRLANSEARLRGAPSGGRAGRRSAPTRLHNAPPAERLRSKAPSYRIAHMGVPGRWATWSPWVSGYSKWRWLIPGLTDAHGGIGVTRPEDLLHDAGLPPLCARLPTWRRKIYQPLWDNILGAFKKSTFCVLAFCFGWFELFSFGTPASYKMYLSWVLCDQVTLI